MKLNQNSNGIVCLNDDTFSSLYGTEPNSSGREIDVDFNLPKIAELPFGDDIVEYFDQLGQRYFNRNKIDQRTDQILNIRQKEVDILVDKMDILLSQARGGVWTKMDTTGTLTEMSEPDCDAMVLDTETFVKGSLCNSPIVGQAIARDFNGNVCFYIYLHPNFNLDSEQTSYEPQKISIGRDKLFVAHSAAFDFQKVKERYTFEKNNVIALCTMAMMKQISGVDDSQRWALNVKDKKKLSSYKVQAIRKFGSKMGLVPCYEFMTGETLPEDSKDLRKIFVKAESFQEFRDSRMDILRYSMLDVVYNLVLFQKCYPVYMNMINHKVILAGQTIVTDAVLPHIDYWSEWIERCDKEYESVVDEAYNMVFPHLKELHDAWLEGKYTPEGTSLDNISWSYITPFRHRKGNPLPDDWPLRASWFEPFQKKEIKLKGRNIQWLLQIEYKYLGEWYETVFVSNEGWNILVDNKYIKLPNKRDPGENYGNLLSSDSLDMISGDEPLLRSNLLDDKDFYKFLELVDSVSTYIGFNKRVKSQNMENGLVAAEVNPCGTISGRTVSALFNTLPAHYKTPKIMSEIKSTMQCPEGWYFVGGDADQQESSVAAAMSDSYKGSSGSNEFSKAVLTGDKDKGTDFHSVMAKKVGVNRSIAKNVNYGLIYGCGAKTAAKTIMQGYTTPPSNVLDMGKQAVYGFKGRKDYNDPTSGYRGGMASNVFNKMEDIIKSKPPSGLFFHNTWPKSLQPKYCMTVGSPPQLNYCIQASCSTYGFLSAWIVAVDDEIHSRGLDARFSVSIHDEAWWLCQEHDTIELSYVIQMCYARVWGLLHYNLFLDEMPFSRAFMTSVSIDKVLRKSPDASTKSPTFDEFPEKGRELTIFDY